MQYFLIIFQVIVTLFSFILLAIGILQKTIFPSYYLLILIVIIAQIILGILLLKSSSINSNIKATISKNPSIDIEISSKENSKLNKKG